MSNGKPKTALIMTGGGARAAYQVGVLRAIAELTPTSSPSPFEIICGTSAGAINAANLATHAHDFRIAVSRLLNIWSNFHVNQVFRADLLGILKTGIHWIFTMLSVGLLGRSDAMYLLDRKPLRQLLQHHFDPKGIQHAIDAGHLHALSITASGYTSHQSVSFFQGHHSLKNWSRSRRTGAHAIINVDHLMASSAIPLIFSPQRINREYFGDGSMRQIAPISPALHLGAERVLVIGNRQTNEDTTERIKAHSHPTLGQIAGHALNSIFLDSLEADIERLERINKTISLIPKMKLEAYDITLRKVDVLVVSPSRDLGAIATKYAQELPWTIRLLLGAIGGLRSTDSSLLSYLLFEKGYCHELITLGYQDAKAQKDQIREMLQLDGAQQAL